MPKFLIISANNNICSQNLEIAKYLNLNVDSELWVSDINDEIPLVGSPNLPKNYFPKPLISLAEKIEKHTFLIFTLSEHNSNFTAYFKNIFDWLSIKERYFLKNKKVLLISASSTKKIKRDFEIVASLTFQSVEGREFKFINCNNYPIEKEQIFKNLIIDINQAHE